MHGRTVNLSPKKIDLLQKSRLFLARAAPEGARDWVAAHATYQPLIAEGEAAIANCSDHQAEREFRSYIAVWFRAFNDYIKTVQPDGSSATPWADLWHAAPDAEGMNPEVWQHDGNAWFCTFTWPDPTSDGPVCFELRSRGAGDGTTAFITAPEHALIEQASATFEDAQSAAQALVRVRSVFPGASLDSVNNVKLVPEFLQ
jgi:hypothetical protein